MANGHPQYGGTNGVTQLDVGQIGGSRNGAGEATYTVRGTPQPAQVDTVSYRAAQQGRVVQDILGYAGGSFRWSGSLKCDSLATLWEIIGEIERKMHGHTKSVNGALGTMDATQLRETKLTDYDGTVISDRARVASWQFTTDRATTPEGKVVVGLDIEFRIL